MTREDNILTYINEWSDGFYDSETIYREIMVERTVENTLAWHNINETPTNLKNYREAFESLVRQGKIEVRRNIFTDSWMFQVPDND